LSKRKDDVATQRFRERGYLPETIFNYLALQGWSYDGVTEIMTRDELIARFTLERIQPSPARWNPEKLRDMNGIYIRKLTTEQLAERVLPFMQRAGLIGDPASETERAYLISLIPLIHERLEELQEAPDLLAFFYQDVVPGETYNPADLIPKKHDAAQTVALLRAAHEALSQQTDWTPPALETTLRALCEQLQVKPGPLFGAIRVAITGRSVAPPLFDTLAGVGRERSLSRLAAAIAALENLA